MSPAPPLLLPLLAPRDLAAPLAWHGGAPVSAAMFLGQAAVLAQGLPAHGRPINLCQDRYRFALGLCAALMRGQTSLLPPNALPETLRGLGHAASADGPAYALVDDAALNLEGLQALWVEPDADATPLHRVPLVPAGLEAVCLLTSGSTGAPQPHAKRWGQLVANIAAAAQRLAELLERPTLAGLNIVATVPAQHSYGLESTVLLALLGGACFEAGRPFYPADIAARLANVPQPRALVTTPFHLKTLLLAGVPLPPVELVLSATAPLSPQLGAQAEAAFNGRLVEIYGCTEAGQVASRRLTRGEIWHTLGELRIWREDGADGDRYIVAGGHVALPTPLADVLDLHDEHHFGLLGRANDLIHVAGKRSSLAHLNYHLNRIEGVEDGTFWMPEEEANGVTRPLVFVVAPKLSARQVIDGLRQHMEPAFVPRRVVHVAALPRADTGKLTALALARFAQEALHDDAEFHIPADHPAFDGHFPGQPVLPGVVLLSLVMQALAARPSLAQPLGATPRLDQVKFLKPAGPGAQLRVRLRALPAGVAFEVLQGEATLARGQWSAGAAA